MTQQEAAELLDLIIERAPMLRLAGIRKVNLGAASFEIDPEGDPESASADGNPVEVEPSLAELLAGTGNASTKKERPPL